MPAERDAMADPGATIVEGSATQGSLGARFMVRRLSAFAREFAHNVPPRRLAGSALLVVLGAASEGIGLFLLVPLIALLGDSPASVGGIGSSAQRAFASLGLPLSLPVLLVVFVAVIMARTVLVAQRDIELASLRVAFADSLRRSVYEAVASAQWSFLARQRLSDIFETLTSHCEGVGIAAYSFLRLPALGLVPRVAVLPHFETFGHRWLPSIRDLAASEGVVLLGIDERSAAMWGDGSWRVEGPGAVTVIDAEGEWRHGAGEPIDGLPAPRVAGNVAG